MDLTLTSAPGATPISLTEAKAHLRVTSTDEDTLIGSLISAATARLDGRHGILGRALVTQSWTVKFDAFPRCWPWAIELPFPPLQTVASVTYVDENGDVQTLDSALYTVEASQFVGRIVLNYGEIWPGTRCEPGAVRVAFTAGFGDVGSDVPMPIRQAMLLLVGFLYSNRDADAKPPAAIDHLIAPFRLMPV